MPDRVLTQLELNRALLARQHLLDRAPLTITAALERIGGLQTQYAPSGYIGLWSRLETLDRTALTTALERRNVVQGTMMRATIHMVSRRDYPVLIEGIRAARRAWWLRATRHQVDARTMTSLARRVRTLLADGPVRAVELRRALQIDGPAWSGVGLWVDLLRVPPSGTWERPRADLYALAELEIGTTPVTERAGMTRLVERYLRGFGPASAKDVASWTGLPPASLQPVLAQMRLRRFLDTEGRPLLDLPRAPLPDPGTPAPVRFLPTWDASLLVHARRTQIVPEAIRPRIFNTKTPHSVPTFLVDGQVAGTWRVEGGSVRTTPFGRLNRSTASEVEAEAARLTAFHA